MTVWLRRRFGAVRRVAPIFFLGVLPAVLTVQILAWEVRSGSAAIDFHHAFWPAIHRVLHGESPFAPVTKAALAHGTAFVYPPLAALLMAPLALLPLPVADAVVTFLLLLTPVACLRLLGVRDRRCYGAVFLWPPVIWAVQTANLSLPLALGAVLLWRYRDRVRTRAVIAGAMIAVKLFLWPLLVWLAATRRRVSAFYALMLAVGGTLGSWAVIGFAGLDAYPHMLGRLTALEAPASYSPQALALMLGAPPQVASGIRYALAGAVLAASVLIARRTDGDRRSFTLALAASILFSPIVWLHYFALLIVPVALFRPRFGGVWLLPAALWACPVRPAGPTWLTVLVLADFAALVGLLVAQHALKEERQQVQHEDRERAGREERRRRHERVGVGIEPHVAAERP